MAASPEKRKAMTQIVQVKTPLELQEFLWKDGALVRAEDAKFPPPERTDFLDLKYWGREPMSLEQERDELVGNTIRYKWMYQNQG